MSIVLPLSQLNNTTVSLHELGFFSLLSGLLFLVEALSPVPELSDGRLLVMDLTLTTLVAHSAVFAHEALTRDTERIDLDIRVR